MFIFFLNPSSLLKFENVFPFIIDYHYSVRFVHWGQIGGINPWGIFCAITLWWEKKHKAMPPEGLTHAWFSFFYMMAGLLVTADKAALVVCNCEVLVWGLNHNTYTCGLCTLLLMSYQDRNPQIKTLVWFYCEQKEKQSFLCHVFFGGCW